MTVYYNTLICIRIRTYFIKMKYFVLNTSSNDITKQFNPFLVETTTCEFTIAGLHHYSCFASMTLPYFMYFIKHALEFGKVKIKL